MIVVVTGSRSLVTHPDRLEFKDRFVSEIESYDPITVHHGGASGPDTWAHMAFIEIARIHRPEPDPTRTPAQRLFDRNCVMILKAIEQANVLGVECVLVSCWDGKSDGTRHAIEFGTRLGLRHIEKGIGGSWQTD